jgi:hypothetical protein
MRNRRRAVENWLGPFLSGLAEVLIGLSLVAMVLWGAAESNSLGHPSDQTFRDLAQVGAALLIAFAVATATASAFTGGDLKDHINWLGGVCGIGISGFLGVAASVGLAAYREAGHAGWLDILGLCWIALSILLLGMLVALLPYASYWWSRASAPDR